MKKFMFLILILALLLSGCGTKVQATAMPTHTAVPTSVHPLLDALETRVASPHLEKIVPTSEPVSLAVEYFVESSTGHAMEITWANNDGGTDSTVATVSWTKSYERYSEDFAYISVLADGDATCRIVVYGKLMDHATSRGDRIFVTCSSSKWDW